MKKNFSAATMVALITWMGPSLAMAFTVTGPDHGGPRHGFDPGDRRPPLPPQPRPPHQPPPPPHHQPPPPPQPRPPHQPPPPPAPVRTSETVHINQYLTSRDIDLMRVFNLYRYNGFNLDAVVVSIRGADPRQQELSLWVDGRLEDQQRPTGWSTSLYTRGWKTIGRDFRDAQLRLISQSWGRGQGGQIFVESITVYMTRNY